MLTDKAVTAIFGLGIYLPVDGSMPLTADWDVGAFGLWFKSLTLNNGGTDGGAIYFDDSLTSYLKSSEDGATLTLSANALYPVTTKVASLGLTTNAWKSISLDATSTDGGAIYFNGVSTSFIKSTNDGSSLQFGGFTGKYSATVGGGVSPYTDYVTSLGSATNCFRAAYLSGMFGFNNEAHWIIGSGAALTCWATTVLRPEITDTCDLGTSGNRWKNLYIWGNINNVGTITTAGVVTQGLVDGIDVSQIPDWINESPFYISVEKENADLNVADTITEHAIYEVDTVTDYPIVRILAAYFLPNAALTAHDTDFATITLSKRNSAGGAKTTLASVTTKITGGSGNWVAFDAEPLTVVADADLDSVLTWEITKSGGGVVVPSGKLFISAAASTARQSVIMNRAVATSAAWTTSYQVMNDIPGMTLTITAIEGERVYVIVNGQTTIASAPSSLYSSISVDGVAKIYTMNNEPLTEGTGPTKWKFQMYYMTDPLSAGTHTIKAGAGHWWYSGYPVTVVGNGGTEGPSFIATVQRR